MGSDVRYLSDGFLLRRRRRRDIEVELESALN